MSSPEYLDHQAAQGPQNRAQRTVAVDRHRPSPMAARSTRQLAEVSMSNPMQTNGSDPTHAEVSF